MTNFTFAANILKPNYPLFDPEAINNKATHTLNQLNIIIENIVEYKK